MFTTQLTVHFMCTKGPFVVSWTLTELKFSVKNRNKRTVLVFCAQQKCELDPYYKSQDFFLFNFKTVLFLWLKFLCAQSGVCLEGSFEIINLVAGQVPKALMFERETHLS